MKNFAAAEGNYNNLCQDKEKKLGLLNSFEVI